MNSKKNLLTIIIVLTTFLVNAQELTNDFYDNAPTIDLTMPSIEITGEISNPGKVDFSKLPLRSVIAKEALLIDGKEKFIGAYRYDGYSLYDILNNSILQKKNAIEFEPIIDLYVEIENAKGEKVVVSWGEIYYPVHRHEIIIATKVARIITSKTKELWTLPTENKLVVCSDLVSERNISTITKITIKSYAKSFTVNKGMSPMFSKSINLFLKNKLVDSIVAYPNGFNVDKYPTIFYGRGKGIHSTSTFNGIQLKEILNTYNNNTKEQIQNGLIVFLAKDGYRCLYTFSEIFNRNDQAEVLLIDKMKVKDGGAFSVFPAADFFSDRAVKAVEAIYIE